MILTILLIFILPIVHGNVFKFERNLNSSFPGKILRNHVMHEFRSKFQISQCAMECARTPGCKSLNFDKKHKLCHLNNATHTEYPADFKDESKDESVDYHLSDAFTIDEEAVGPCGSHPCKNDGRCVDTKDSKDQRIYICICKDGWSGQNCQRPADILQWTSWENWGTCSVSCGHGYHTRRRHCENVSTGARMAPTECYGRAVQYGTCPYRNCPKWKEWGEWGECSTYTTCGRGYKLRHRNCSDDGTAGMDRYCKGPMTDTAVCEGITCKGIVRLVNSKKFGDGKVEMYDNIQQQWFQVCGDKWDHKMVDILCKQSGFEGAGISTLDKGNIPDDSDKDMMQSSALNDTGGTASTNTAITKQALENITLTCSTGNESTLHQCKRQKSTDCQGHAVAHCRVRGAWALWTYWSECSVTCENGTRTRTRTCDHPPPNYAGTPCPGANTEHKLCTLKMCPIDGYWTAWSEWSDCSVTCENGTQYRTRQCVGPYYNGSECDGDPKEIRDCFPKMCPVDGVWYEWTEWTQCTVTCGYGTRKRDRNCNGPFYDGANCIGPNTESEVCNAFSCPVDGSWKIWENWQDCSVTCGGGHRNRTRECNLPEHGGEHCLGPTLQTEACNEFNCPVDGIWTAWTNWTECTVTCGGGYQERNRTCIGPYYGGANCSGEPDKTRNCSTQHCPVDGYWKSWTLWSHCNVSCGGGIRWRDRKCEQPLHGGAPCDGEDFQTETCKSFKCPVDGMWNNWALWSDCTVTCGNGTKNRSRTCIGPFFKGQDCEGNSFDEEQCNTHECPVDGVYTTWTDWSDCSLSCGRGIMKRNRTCDGPYHGGSPCVGDPEESTYCNPSNCPVNGLWMSWSPWGACNVTCGGGMRGRGRECNGPYYGGKPCEGSENDTDTCNTQNCPIDGVFFDWSEWYNCNVTCGGGIQWRNRTCNGPFYEGAPCQGNINDAQSCNSHHCPIDGVFENWSEWYNCNVTCGGGTQWRNRTCNGPFHKGSPCYGDYNDSQSCNMQECPIDGEFNIWSDWYNCNVTCGGGIQWRNRTCIGPYHGGDPCYGDFNDSQSCNMHECPVDGLFSDWSDWYNCDLTCGGGIQWRNRSCIGTAFGGMPCKGAYNDSQACNEFNCPIDGNWTMWTEWDQCNVTCGGGGQFRYRQCYGPFYGGANCTGVDSEMQSCNEHNCPINGTWGNWTEWDTCNVTCGGGTQHRYRDCIGPFYGGFNCTGNGVDGQDCNTHNCPVDGVFTDWSTWGSCDVSCGGGIQWRNRSCNGPYYGGAPCDGFYNDSRNCNTEFCPIDGVWRVWSNWGDCPVTCGGDVSIRTRTCVGPYYLGRNCSGNWSEDRPCGLDPCPIPGDWFGWGSWSQCSVTCDGGTRSRTRVCDMDSYGNLTAPCLGNATDNQPCHTWKCSNYALHCRELGEWGLVDDGYYDIDPDGDGPLEPVGVKCVVNYDNISFATVIEHNSQKRIYVEGYETAGGFERIVGYKIDEAHIKAIIGTAKSCKQHLRWDCYNSVIMNPTFNYLWVTYWTHRNPDPNPAAPKYIAADYFPGAERGSKKCACAMNDTCATKPNGDKVLCNCNVNDNTWKRDEGDVTYKEHLPIHAFKAGDTGDDDEEGYVTIGPVICWGIAK